MFRITEDPSSGSLVQCLTKNYKNGSIVSVEMDKVGVMAAFWPVVSVCSSLYMDCLRIQWTTHTHNVSEYAVITPTLSMSTDTIESFLWLLAKHYTRLPDDGSSVNRNMLEHFEIFYNFNCIYILYIVH